MPGKNNVFFLEARNVKTLNIYFMLTLRRFHRIQVRHNACKKSIKI